MDKISSPAKTLSRRKRNNCDSLMRYAELLGYGEIHVKQDKKTGLQCVVSIHNLKRGPAIGGCRFVAYTSISQAMEDAMRLGYMMSYKAAINNLPHGGGKGVIIKPKVIKDYDAFFESYGEFVNDLGGRYITAVDSGSSTKEMDIIARKTKFVTCTTVQGGDGDPSPLTALGVLRGIEAAAKFKLQRDSVEGLHVTIQGVGHVGYPLAKDLHERGAKLTVTDINPAHVKRCVDEFNANVCAPDAIFDIECDVFAPCALGAILNRETIARLKTKIVAGSANNQLAHHHYGTLLHERGILYAPDFLINAGGVIHVAVIYDHGNVERSIKKIDEIYDIVMDIFARAEHENCATNIIAERIAREKLY